ncbi:MAG: TIGR01777 family oxidoreductase [Candidatus Hydrothermales bacterium]
MKILITGGTGFIGKELSLKLLEEGHTLYVLTRSVKKGFNERINFLLWDGKEIKEDLKEIDAVINLAGESIFSLFYNENKKKRIIESRVNAGRGIIEYIKRKKVRPKLLIQASAIGYYGNSYEEKDEFSPPGNDFLSKVCIEWEKSTEEVEKIGIRRCIVRIGIVFGKGGFISKILSFPQVPFLFLIGEPQNFISFIHIKDLINAIIFLLKNKNSKGVYNLVSPNPIKLIDFYKTLSKILNKRLLRFPNFIFKILMGNMADEIVFFNNRIIPRRILEENFKFLYPDLERSLKDILLNYENKKE